MAFQIFSNFLAPIPKPKAGCSRLEWDKICKGRFKRKLNSEQVGMENERVKLLWPQVACDYGELLVVIVVATSCIKYVLCNDHSF